MYQLVKGIDPDHITYAVEDSKQLGVLADFYGTADVRALVPDRLSDPSGVPST